MFGTALINLIKGEMKDFTFISGSLFFSSLLINTAITITTCIFGIFISIFIWTYFEKGYKKIFLAVLLCALIPPFIHVHSWIKTMDAFNALIDGFLGISMNFTGIGAVILTSSFSYLPFTISFCLLGLLSIPVEMTDMMKTEIKPVTLFFKGIMPYFAPYVFISGIFIFLITMNDFAISSAFGVNVFALELFSLFSASGNLYAIALSSVPVIVLSVILLIFLGKITKRYDMTGDPVTNSNPYKKEMFMKISAWVGCLLFVLFAAIPAGSMLIESFYTKDFFLILTDSWSELGYSFWISGVTAATSVVFSVLLAYSWYHSRKKMRLVLLLAFPFLIPSAILGLSLIVFWNSDVLSTVYRNPVMPAIGLSIRFCIFSILFFTVRLQKIEKNLMEAIQISYSFLKGFFQVLIPMIWKDILACLLLIFALAMGEYGIVLLITPPGYQMLTIKIYNYLHYGASEVVFALNFFVFILVLIIGIIIFTLYKPENDLKAGSK